MDFVTVVYNDRVELNLLKLQAISFKYVDINIINNIYILYNDVGKYDFTEIITFYPSPIQTKVKIIYNTEIDDCFHNSTSSWSNQRIIKLLVAKMVSSPYYLVLDSKNHFIRNITIDDYFDGTKPILFHHNPGNMIRYYYNCLQYFDTKDPFNYVSKGNHNLLTTTPFLMCKQDVLELIEYVVKREKEKFYLFFEKNNNNYCEFYLYSTYLIFKNKLKDCSLKPINFITVFGINSPGWDSDSKNNRCLTALHNPNLKCFGLHRKAIPLMDDEYKKNILLFYHHFFDDVTCDFIKKEILNYKTYKIRKL